MILKSNKKVTTSRVHLLNSFNLLNRNVNEFRKALTHASYYGTEEESLGCSRYVFLGMFGFKGKVAKLLYDYVPGKGQSLQHILGNLFAMSRMEAFFDKWELEKFCRYCPNFKIDLNPLKNETKTTSRITKFFLYFSTDVNSLMLTSLNSLILLGFIKYC